MSVFRRHLPRLLLHRTTRALHTRPLPTTTTTPEQTDTPHLVDSWTRQPQPLGTAPVTWYTCGPTVYDACHLGHAWTYVQVDIMQRLLRAVFGRRVQHTLNITDIDDKVVLRARERDIPVRQLAQHYEHEFMAQMDALRVTRPDTVLRVTDHIPTIVDYIARIHDHGHAYAGPDGTLWFDTTAYTAAGHTYGALTTHSLADEADAPAHPETGALGKRTAADFALWKPAREGDPSDAVWDSPWGPGRPGWHIECSALCTHAFGAHVDVHAGGVDLCFPHHENEVAQCTSYHAHASHRDWARLFVHIQHLHIGGRKMSKSLKNFTTVSQMLASHSPDDFRMFCLLHSPYRPVHIAATLEVTLAESHALLQRLRAAVADANVSLADADAAAAAHPRAARWRALLAAALDPSAVIRDAAARAPRSPDDAALALWLAHAVGLDVLQRSLPDHLQEAVRLRGVLRAAIQSRCPQEMADVPGVLTALADTDPAIAAVVAAHADPHVVSREHSFAVCDALRDWFKEHHAVALQDGACGAADWRWL